MKQPGTISRRRLVTAGLGAVAAPAVLRVLPANAQSRVIKIGHVSPRTGPIAAFGEADPFVLEQVQKLVEKGISKDRKSTRLNSSHQIISYAVFCLKKKKKNITIDVTKCTMK